MKTIYTLISIFIISNISFAQSEWCKTDKIYKELTTDSKFKQTIHKGFLNAASGKFNSNQKVGTLYVPVVVHVIHDNGIGNISDEQIYSALEVLNTDYRRENSDTTVTRQTVSAPFKDHSGGMNIQFELARLDPLGNCTNGIVRVNAPHLTYNAGESCKYDANGGSSAWPKDKYLNIWVVNNIDTEGSGGIIAGYAYYPYGAETNDGYGILMDDSYMGTIETAANDNGRVLTHEMGHALGLAHIFDPGFSGVDGCHTQDCSQNGDYVCDTPPQIEASWTCALSLNTCDEIPVNDPYGFDALDQIENYMSYNSCQNMFSADQVSIMETNFNDISFLSNMVTPANAIATGIHDPFVLCEAEFDSYRTTVCVNEEVELLDYSYSNVTGWSWNVSNAMEGVDFNYTQGTNANSQNPIIQFLIPGVYSISLEANDGASTVSTLKNNFVTVLPNDNNLPFLESFESFGSFNNTPYWGVTNISGPNSFEVASGVAHTGNQCAKLENFGEPSGSLDELLSAPVDLTPIQTSTEVTLSFRYAYRKQNEANYESLKVLVSNNCGASWVSRKSIQGNLLGSSVEANPWTPSLESDWVTVHMTNITSSYWISNFRYKFQFEGDNGNNFYLDDINIYSGSPSDDLVTESASISELTDVSEINLFPNPADNELNLRFNANIAQKIQVQITDVLGKSIQSNSINANSGTNLIMMDTKELSPGAYFLSVYTGDEIKTLQFVIK